MNRFLATVIIFDIINQVKEKMNMHNWHKKIVSIVTALVVLCTCVVPVMAKTDGNGSLVYKSDNSSTFDPGGATYSRIICLKNSGNENGTLLCTYDQLKNVSVDVGNGKMVSKQVYPIYKSTDGGDNWTLISNVYDKEYGLLRTSQPCL